MRMYLHLGDETAEQWIRTMLSLVEWVDTPEAAEVAVVSQPSEAKAALQARVEVRWVAGDQRAADMARRLGLRDNQILALPASGHLSAADVLAFVARALGAPPVHLSPSPVKVQVMSSRQAGGTFFAWNLWHVLKTRGVRAKLLSASSASPLAAWLSPPYEDIVFGAIETEDGEVWIIDTSDTNVVVDADATILVQDCDPAKVPPVAPEAVTWCVVNRVPAGLEVASEAQLILPDFGAAAYEAMTTGVPVAARHPNLADALWRLWGAIEGNDLQVRIEVALEPTEDVSNGEGEKYEPHDQKDELGFVFDE